MSGFLIRERLLAGEKVFAAWLSSASARVAEMVMRAAFDCALFDLQHGEATLAEMRDAIGAVRFAGKASGVRVSLDNLAEAARCLDLGAEIAIMPMVNTPADARALVDTLRYPPLGGRSWGPTRGLSVLGLDAETYRRSANHGTIVLAMIETLPGIDNLDQILDVPGLDGVFVGPSDLSISLTKGAVLDWKLPEGEAVMRRVVAAAHARGKIAAIYSQGGEGGKRHAGIGFDIMGVGSDWGFLADGARRAFAMASGRSGDEAASY